MSPFANAKGLLLCYFRGDTLFHYCFHNGLHCDRSLEGPLSKGVQAEYKPADAHVADDKFHDIHDRRRWNLCQD